MKNYLSVMHMLWYFRHDVGALVGSLAAVTSCFTTTHTHTCKHTPSVTPSSLQTCERVTVAAHMHTATHTHTHTHAGQIYIKCVISVILVTGSHCASRLRVFRKKEKERRRKRKTIKAEKGLLSRRSLWHISSQLGV